MVAVPVLVARSLTVKHLALVSVGRRDNGCLLDLVCRGRYQAPVGSWCSLALGYVYHDLASATIIRIAVILLILISACDSSRALSALTEDITQ